MSLLRMSLVAVLALGATTPSAAAAKTVLVLKEEKVRVPEGAEVAVAMPNICEQYTAERGLYREPLTFHGHLAVNGAQTDVLKFTPEESGCITGNLGLYAVNFYGHLQEMTLAQHGKANTLASLVLEPSPHSGFSVCVYDFNAYAGKFRVPGQAYIEGKVRGRLDEAKTYKGVGKCRKKVAGPFTIGVYGRNGKPLETELVAATGR